MPRGGARPGSGRKRLTAEEKAARKAARLAAQQARVLTPQFGGVAPPSSSDPATEMAPIEEFDAPDSLTFDERQVWLRQAPHAFRNRTLTKATAVAFERYCRMVARESIEARSSAAEGPNHRGLRREINALELQFLLSPNGRPMVEPMPASPAVPVPAGLSRFRS